MYQAAIHSFKCYAKRVGADLIISDSLHYPIHIHQPKYGANPAWAEKLRIGELLKQYDRVLYVDADILISPSAEDIFQEYCDLDTIYMLDEGMHCDRHIEKQLIEKQLGSITWPQHDAGVHYYNVGVMLISKPCQLFNHLDLNSLQAICNEIRFYEQTLFNYVIFQQRLKHQAIDCRFNRMDMFGQDSYLQADFIHYAGKGYAKNNRRRDLQFLKDFALLYKDIIPQPEIQRLKHVAWQQFLEKVYQKYSLPNALIKAVSGACVSR
ncbi:hypothetical protein PPRY_a0162 [Pseudoalteromonas prydzensis ACAM 620]|nr:hypothetical protein [Pseudoalteromonas prydzensis ACAM 620]